MYCTDICTYIHTYIIPYLTSHTLPYIPYLLPYSMYLLDGAHTPHRAVSLVPFFQPAPRLFQPGGAEWSHSRDLGDKCLAIHKSISGRACLQLCITPVLSHISVLNLGNKPLPRLYTLSSPPGSLAQHTLLQHSKMSPQHLKYLLANVIIHVYVP